LSRSTWWQDRIPREGESEQEAIVRLHQSPGYGGSLEDAKCAVWDAMDFSRHFSPSQKEETN